jgi:hypothetical protein
MLIIIMRRSGERIVESSLSSLSTQNNNWSIKKVGCGGGYLRGK